MNQTVPVKTKTRPVSRKTVAGCCREGDFAGKSGWNLTSEESLAEFGLRFGFLAMSGRVGFREVR